MINLQYLFMYSQDTRNAKHDNSQYLFMYSQDTQNPKHDNSSVSINVFSRYSES